MRSGFSNTERRAAARPPIDAATRLRAKALRRAAALAVCLAGSGAVAQVAPAGAAASSPNAAACDKTLADLNAGLRGKTVDALLTAATLQESGRCVARDDAKAAQYLGEAAKAGSRLAALRLARHFGRGRGVPQSYANAGAWVSGKGLSDEPIEKWDYSVGYAYTVLSELLAGVRYPPLAAGRPAELSFAIEIDAAHPARLVFRKTAAGADGAAAQLAAIEKAFAARLPEVLKWIAPPDARYITSARVAVPVSVRYRAANEVAVFEDEVLLR